MSKGSSLLGRACAALAGAWLTALAGVAFAQSCSLDPVKIDAPPTEFIGQDGITIEEMLYEFDPPAEVVISGREITVSNVTERTRSNVRGLVQRIFDNATRGLPRDECKTIVDGVSWSASAPDAGGSMSLTISGNGRQRECAKWDYPCFEGIKWYTCRATSSATLGDFKFRITYRIDPVVNADATRVDFKLTKTDEWSDFDIDFGFALTLGALTQGMGIVLVPVLEEIGEEKAEDQLQAQAGALSSGLARKLPRIEAYLDIDREYRRLRIQRAGFANGTLFNVTRRLPTPRNVGVVCALRSMARQAEALADNIRNPRTTYVVQEDDSLWDVADDVYGDGRYHLFLSQINDLESPDVIRPGTSLAVPRIDQFTQKGEHLVKGRESLWEISRSELDGRSDFGRLQNANSGLENPDLIYPLQLIELPDAPGEEG